jgi:hypothetical protein
MTGGLKGTLTPHRTTRFSTLALCVTAETAKSTTVDSRERRLWTSSPIGSVLVPTSCESPSSVESWFRFGASVPKWGRFEGGGLVSVWGTVPCCGFDSEVGSRLRPGRSPPVTVPGQVESMRVDEKAENAALSKALSGSSLIFAENPDSAAAARGPVPDFRRYSHRIRNAPAFLSRFQDFRPRSEGCGRAPEGDCSGYATWPRPPYHPSAHRHRILQSL